ncbi:hypothetical protein, partial [Escherichia coli]|uniref:hypothetical protein n=1 Tax=Escherichia coli TaxID=562 RepID=UPI002739F4DA
KATDEIVERPLYYEEMSRQVVPQPGLFALPETLLPYLVPEAQKSLTLKKLPTEGAASPVEAFLFYVGILDKSAEDFFGQNPG